MHLNTKSDLFDCFCLLHSHPRVVTVVLFLMSKNNTAQCISLVLTKYLLVKHAAQTECVSRTNFFLICICACAYVCVYSSLKMALFTLLGRAVLMISWAADVSCLFFVFFLSCFVFKANETPRDLELLWRFQRCSREITATVHNTQMIRYAMFMHSHLWRAPSETE